MLCSNPGHQVARLEFVDSLYGTCFASTFLAPEILRWILDFWKNVRNPPLYINFVNFFRVVLICSLVFTLSLLSCTSVQYTDCR